MLNLTVLFFVVTGIQYWVKAFLEEVIGSDGSVVGIAFVFVSATAPTGGVIFGGWLIDRLGGYGGPVQILKTLRINASLGACAVACCLAILFMDSLAPIMTLIWLLLFSGGATVPSLTGIIVSSVKPSLRSFASSLSQLSFNILGFALSTLIPGVVMEFTGSREWGFNTVMLWSVWGVIVTMFGIWAAMDNVKLMRRFVDGNCKRHLCHPYYSSSLTSFQQRHNQTRPAIPSPASKSGALRCRRKSRTISRRSSLASRSRQCSAR